MPTITNETVIGSGYVTSRNARPQLLSNGWIVAAVYSSSATRLQFRVKKTVTGAWEDLAFLTTSNILSWSLAVKGTRVFATLHTSSSNATSFLNFEATTVSSTVSQSAVSIDNTSTSGQFSGEDLITNDAGTELHHAFSAKTPTYPNGFNIRYLKGTISLNGTVSWSSIQDLVTTVSGQNFRNPAMTLTFDGRPSIAYEFLASTSFMITRTFNGSIWAESTLEYGGTNLLTNVSYCFVPQSVNGLPKGRLWAAWQGKDATDNTKFNIRTSYSDDSGVTWATPTKQTTGNTYDQTNASLTADAQGKVLLTWDAQNATTTQTALKVFNGTWGATTMLTGDGYTNVATLFDSTFKLGMTSPPLIRQSTSGVYFSGNYSAGDSVSPASSALGDKTAASVLSYTVAPESGSTVTSIVEKINGTTVNTYSNPASLSRTFTIPPANWDALKYYNTHTISVTVTDSNGMANTQVYSFNKALANDASLLEGTKAAKDGKDRISTKRDALATQVGLPPGSTFDAISAQLASGNALKKFASGTVTSSATRAYTFKRLNDATNISMAGLTLPALDFTPSLVIVRSTADPAFLPSSTSFIRNHNNSPLPRFFVTSNTASYNGVFEPLGNNDYSIVPVDFVNANFTWTAIQ